MYNWVPRIKGPIKVLKITYESGVSINGISYPAGSMLEVLQETEDLICIHTKRLGNKECFKKKNILTVAKLDTGYVNDYRGTLGTGSIVFLIFVFPNIVWIFSAIVIRRLKVDHISRPIQKNKK